MKIGAHVSTAGGISKAPGRAQEIGCEAIQIFGSSPQGWGFKAVPEEEIEFFKQNAAAAGIGAIFLHAIYLIILGPPNQANLPKGIDSLVKYMTLASDIGATGVIVHPGSHGGAGYESVLPQTVEVLKTVLDWAPDGPYLAMENMAGTGQHIGARFEKLGGLMEAVAQPRLKICLDTQHCFAAGYDLAPGAGMEDLLDQLESGPGRANVVAIHANDSKRPCGSGVDRHDNVGDGFIGEDGFAVFMGHPAFRDIPFLLEVPGFDGNGPDLQNVEILKRIREQAEVAP